MRDDVCAVIVTRGNVDLDPILRSLPTHWGCVVWNNKVEVDLSVYGRYAGIERAVAASRDDLADVRAARLIYVQDDDCVLAPESFDELEAKWQPGYVVCNMPALFRQHYSDSALVGFGALFERDLPAKAFDRFHRAFDYGADALFTRECDAVFTTLTPRILVDVAYENLPWATGPDRLYRQPEHVGARAAMLALARKARDL